MSFLCILDINHLSNMFFFFCKYFLLVLRLCFLFAKDSLCCVVWDLLIFYFIVFAKVLKLPKYWWDRCPGDYALYFHLGALCFQLLCSNLYTVLSWLLSVVNDRSVVSFFIMWPSKFPHIICLRDYPFPIVCSQVLRWKIFDHVCGFISALLIYIYLIYT